MEGMTPPALVASDLDGTLLRTDRTVGARTLAALARLRAHDVPFVMVTGRPIRWLAEVVAQTGPPTSLTVCSNGAVIYDGAADQVVEHRPLAPELLAHVVERLQDRYPDVAFAAETNDGLRHEAHYPINEISPLVRPGELAELIASPAIKLLARLDGAPDAVAEQMSESLRGVAEVTRSSHDCLIEISAAGVTKATGLAWVAQQYGVPPERIVAFGDMPNDLPMFGFVGHSVAMANAEPAVRAAADAVTTSNDDDGIADYLDRLFEPAPID
nr:HAD family hydrolase [Actinocatenispora thailandica]